MKDTVEPMTAERTLEHEPFVNRRLVRPSLSRSEHNHNHAPAPAGERRERLERSDRGSSDRAPSDRASNGKKPAPPEQTNAENFYYQKQMQTKTPMVIVLQDDEEVHGIIEWYDKCCLKVNREGEPNLMIYKPAIKYMYKEGENEKK